jgi:hypothetical protein
MTDMRTRLKGLGISEARLGAIGMGAPSTTAPATTTAPTSIFRQRQAENEAAKQAAKRAPTSFTTAQLEHRANAMFVLERYRAAPDLGSRLRIRTEHGDLLALAHQIEAESLDNPDPLDAA